MARVDGIVRAVLMEFSVFVEYRVEQVVKFAIGVLILVEF